MMITDQRADSVKHQEPPGCLHFTPSKDSDCWTQVRTQHMYTGIHITCLLSSLYPTVLLLNLTRIWLYIEYRIPMDTRILTSFLYIVLGHISRLLCVYCHLQKIFTEKLSLTCQCNRGTAWTLDCHVVTLKRIELPRELASEWRDWPFPWTTVKRLVRAPLCVPLPAHWDVKFPLIDFFNILR